MGLIIDTSVFVRWERSGRKIDFSAWDDQGEAALSVITASELLHRKPASPRVAEVAAVHFGQDTSRWQAGRRVDDASRAVATYLARRHYGYSAKAVAAAFGYRGHSGVNTALLRIEDGTTQLRKTINHLAKALDKRLTAL